MNMRGFADWHLTIFLLDLSHCDYFDLIMCDLCRGRELPVHPSARRLVCILLVPCAAGRWTWLSGPSLLGFMAIPSLFFT